MTKAAKVLRVSLSRATNNQCIGQVQCKAFEQFAQLKTGIHALFKKRHVKTQERLYGNMEKSMHILGEQ